MDRIPILCGVHSEYELHSSVFKLDDLERVSHMGYRAVMIVDTQPVGWMKFIKRCKTLNLKPVIALPFENDLLVAMNTSGIFELFQVFNDLLKPQSAKHLERISPPVWHVRYPEPPDRRALEILSSMESKEIPEGYHLPEPSEYIKFLLKNGFNPDILLEFESAVKDYHPKIEHEFPVSADRKSIEEEAKHSLRVERKLDEVYFRRLRHELEEMEIAGILDYVATIREVVRTCREVDAWVGPGRGSAVGSLVCYTLGITKVDPVEHELLFERFLNRARKELPDIDIDVEDRKRHEVIEALKKKFGRFSVLNILTFGTLGEKALRSELKRLGKSLKKPLNIDSRSLKLLLGLPHHRSSHAAGLIISKEDLRTIVPVDQENEVILMDMGDLEDFGLVKIDLLGLRTLSFLRDVAESAEIASDDIHMNDAKAYHVISQGLTTGIFQLESRQATQLSISISPENLNEVSDLIALNRPGPLQSGMVDEYIRHGTHVKTEYLHSSLEPILSRTRGTLIYQEQVMELAMKIAGFSPEDADVLRRAMAKKDVKLLEELKHRFIEGAMNRGISESISQMLFDWIQNFAGYAFNRSHSIAYAHLTYLSAYLKAHAPELFYQIYLAYNAGNERKCWRAVNEARFSGLKIFKIGEKRNGEKGVEIPVSCVRGIGPQLAVNITDIFRSDMNFEEAVDQLNRSGIHLKLVENLIKAGAFDTRISTRSGALKKLRRILEGLTEPVLLIQRQLFGIVKEEKPDEEERESAEEKVLMELESLGFPVTLMEVPEDLERFRDSTLCELSLKFARGVAPFKSLKWNGMSIVSDGKCTIALREELPESGVAFFDFSSRKVIKGVAEHPERVERIYRRLLKPEEILSASEENIMTINSGSSRIKVEGAVARSPDEVIFY